MHIVRRRRQNEGRATRKGPTGALAEAPSEGEVVVPVEMRRRLGMTGLVVTTEEDGGVVAKPTMSLEDAFGVDWDRMRQVPREVSRKRRLEAESKRPQLRLRRGGSSLSSTGSLASHLSSPPPTSKSSGRTLCLATSPCMGRVKRWPDQSPLKEACELLDSEPRVSYGPPQRPPGQFAVSWCSRSAMRFFLLSHDDVGTGLVVGFEPCLG